MAVLVSDTFTRADNPASLGNADTGQAWVAQSGTWGILSNQGYNPSGGSQRTAAIQAGTSDIDTSVDITLAASANAGIVFRVLDATNYLLLVVTTTDIELWKVFGAGTFVNLANSGVLSLANSTHTFRLTAAGALITAYIDSVSTLTFTLSGADQTTYSAYTKIGLRAHLDTTTRWDNLSVQGNIAAASHRPPWLPHSAWTLTS